MTFLYDARYSLVLIRPKNEVKLLTQSAFGQICMGNGVYQIGGIKFVPLSCSPVYRIFPPRRRVPYFWENYLRYTTDKVAGEKLNKN